MSKHDTPVVNGVLLIPPARRTNGESRLPRSWNEAAIIRLTMEIFRVAGAETVAFFVRLLLRLLFRLEVHGRLPHAEKLLIVSNHQSFLDGVILGAFLPVSPTYLIHSSVTQKWYFRLPLSLIRHVIVDT